MMRVRVSTPADFARVQALVFGMHARALAATGRDVTARLPLIFPSLASAAAFAAPTSHFWVAVDEDAATEIVGAISIIGGEGDAGVAADGGVVAGGAAVAELNAFYVADAHQRRGVGARLMEAALAFCRASGVKRVDLTSNRGHYDAAIAFYARRGFVETREYEVAPGIVLVDMALELR